MTRAQGTRAKGLNTQCLKTAGRFQLWCECGGGTGYKIHKKVIGCEKQDQTQAMQCSVGSGCEGGRHENGVVTQETTDVRSIMAQEYLELKISQGYLTRPYLTYPRSGL